VLGRGRLGVREAQEVAVRPAVALAVLDDLVGERVDVLALVPRADRAAQPAAPAAELLDVGGEVEQVRADAADLGERVERGALGLLIAVRGGQREREDRRVVLRRAALALTATISRQRAARRWRCSA
jgi:hypothetical protein